MKTVTLKISDAINDKFARLLEHFSADEIKVLDQDEYVDDDTYLRSIKGMVKSIQEARQEPIENGVKLNQKELESDPLFGMWRDREDMTDIGP